MISIQGIDKAELFAALYNYAQPQGLGFLHFDPQPMTVEEARTIIQGDGAAVGGDYAVYPNDKLYFDYFRGRVMKVDLSGDELYEGAYDRDNGRGAVERIVNAIRLGQEPPSLEKQRIADKIVDLAAMY